MKKITSTAVIILIKKSFRYKIPVNKIQIFNRNATTSSLFFQLYTWYTHYYFNSDKNAIVSTPSA